MCNFLIWKIEHVCNFQNCAILKPPSSKQKNFTYFSFVYYSDAYHSFEVSVIPLFYMENPRIFLQSKYIPKLGSVLIKKSLWHFAGIQLSRILLYIYEFGQINRVIYNTCLINPLTSSWYALGTKRVKSPWKLVQKIDPNIRHNLKQKQFVVTGIFSQLKACPKSIKNHSENAHVFLFCKYVRFRSRDNNLAVFLNQFWNNL